jgi:hypothetical protein
MKRHVISMFGIALLITGCSHTHQFNPSPDIGTLEQSPLTGKRLFLDLTQTPEVHEDKASGHRFRIIGIREHTEHVTWSLFRNETFVENPAEADVVLSPSLRFEISTALLGAKCVCTASWDIKDATGKVIATGSASQETSFPAIANGGRNCEISALQAVSAALDNAFANLPELPAAAPSGACTRDTDCSGDFVCSSGKCQPYTPASAAPAEPGGACTKDMDCPGDLVCTGGTCRVHAPSQAFPAGSSGVCAKDIDCPGEQICNDGKCANPAAPTGCVKDTDCKGDRICENGKCVSPQ